MLTRNLGAGIPFISLHKAAIERLFNYCLRMGLTSMLKEDFMGFRCAGPSILEMKRWFDYYWRRERTSMRKVGSMGTCKLQRGEEIKISSNAVGARSGPQYQRRVRRLRASSCRVRCR